MLNPTNVFILFNPRKLVPTKIKPSTVLRGGLKRELNSTSAYVPADERKKLLQRRIGSLTKSNIKIDKIDLPTFSWLPKLHKYPKKLRFISNSSHCSTTILSKHITTAHTTVKYHAIKYSETAFSNSNVNYFWSIKNSSEVIEKLRLRNFKGSQVSFFDFSTLYASLPHDPSKEKVLSLVKWCFNGVKNVPLYFR